MKNYKVSTLNKISPIGLERFNNQYEIAGDDSASSADAIMVRSQDMLSMNFGSNLKAIARAGAGVNNIPLDRCAESGVVVFNTPGANANAVKELIICAMLLAARNIPKALIWADGLRPLVKEDGSLFDVAKQVEKGKSQFAGNELLGKTLTIIGLGAIGRKVASSAYALGMKIVGYDPFYSERDEDVNYTICQSPDEALAMGDYVTLHLPANDSTKKMFNSKLFSSFKDGAVLLNFSRDKLIDFGALADALESGKISKYLTDFPTDDLVGHADNVILLPHLGASTEEAEDNCAVMAADEIINFIENGNIINSVNFPRLDMGKKGDCTRIALITKGLVNPVMDLMELMAEKNLMVQKTMSVRREDSICYTLFEVNGEVKESDFEDLDYLISARII